MSLAPTIEPVAPAALPSALAMPPVATPRASVADLAALNRSLGLTPAPRLSDVELAVPTAPQRLATAPVTRPPSRTSLIVGVAVVAAIAIGLFVMTRDKPVAHKEQAAAPIAPREPDEPSYAPPEPEPTEPPAPTAVTPATPTKPAAAPATHSNDSGPTATPGPRTRGTGQRTRTTSTATDDASEATEKPRSGGAGNAEQAKAAYAEGNQALFAGDAAGAIRAYRQALAAAPGFVAGYRGLGLAYTQQGNKAKAIDAFEKYLDAAPGANDVELIKKRIAQLKQ